MAHLMAIALCMLAFAFCGNYLTNTSANSDTPNITMTVSPNNNKVVFCIEGSGKITIDWGDGKVNTKWLWNFNKIHWFTHSYSGSSAYTIKISATALRHLDCSYNQLTKLDLRANTALTSLHCWTNELTSLDVSNNIALTHLELFNNQVSNLDVSKNTALTHLYCDNNQLTELNLSANTALKRLNCESNNLSADALNALFETLHNNTFEYGKTIYIADNPGTYDCDISIAERKGWKVNTETLPPVPIF